MHGILTLVILSHGRLCHKYKGFYDTIKIFLHYIPWYFLKVQLYENTHHVSDILRI